MKPVYFPFTYVSNRVAKALAGCFGQFTVYRPMNDNVPEEMQRWIERGVLELRVPAAENEQALKAAVKNYLDWAKLHLGDPTHKSVDLKPRMGSLPFFNDFSSAKIVAEVKDKIQGGSIAKSIDSTLTARLFLCLAQEFDRQNQEAARELYRYHQKNSQLISQLKMEEDLLADELQKAPTPDLLADYMVFDRLQAWTRIFHRDPDQSALFVTDSPAVMMHLRERSPSAARVVHLDAVPLDIQKTAAGETWRKNLAMNLDRLAQNEHGATADVSNDALNLPHSENTASLDVYLVPDLIPCEFFAHFVELREKAPCIQPAKFINTLIALIRLST
jgi:hypothetical protein